MILWCRKCGAYMGLREPLNDWSTDRDCVCEACTDRALTPDNDEGQAKGGAEKGEEEEGPEPSIGGNPIIVSPLLILARFRRLVYLAFLAIARQILRLYVWRVCRVLCLPGWVTALLNLGKSLRKKSITCFAT